MSQITRCPSCTTMFKVVADQLRISDGWVRCGHCQQVFDASAHLQPAQPPALIPDLALDKMRAPPQPVSRADVQPRAWGTGSAPGPMTAAAPGPAAATAPAGSTPMQAPEGALPAGVPAALRIPEPRVPAFLAAHQPAEPPGGADNIPPLAPVPEAPFAWRTPEPATVRPAPAVAPDAAAAGIEWPTIEFPPAPAGYELPSPVLEESDLRDFLEPASTVEAEPHPQDVMKPRPEPEPEPEPEAAPAAAVAVVQEPALPGAPGDQDVPDAPDPATGPVATDAMPAPPPEGSPDEPSFVRAARRKAFWRRPPVRAGLVVLGLLLSTGLLFQVALQERHYLAAVAPQSRALLQALCAPLQCQVGPYRHIASVVVDGSSFHRLRGEDYQFSLTLRNRADHAVEMPAVELTLTDAQEQPVLRRVLQPQELAGPSELLPQAEWSVAMPVQMALGGARVTGYRVLVFYP